MLAGILLGINTLLAPRQPSAVKAEPYECGIPSEGTDLNRHPVKFFLTAVLFLLFDIEAVFLFPWAVVFREFNEMGAGLFLLGEMAFFLAILVLGFVYIWKKGALKWES